MCCVRVCWYRARGCQRFFFAWVVFVHLRSTPAWGSGREGWFTIVGLDDSVFLVFGRLSWGSGSSRSTCFPPSFLLLILYQHDYHLIYSRVCEVMPLLFSSLLTFYIPIFFTFRYLMLNNTEKVRAILKFWCILTLYSLGQKLL